MKKKKIVLAGASTYGVKNMGDDAMLYNLTQTLHRKIDCEIVFLARHPEAGYDDEYGIRSIKNFEHDSAAQSKGRFFYGFNRGDDRKNLDRIRQEIEDCDLVVIGGNAFMEVSENSVMRGLVSYTVLVATLAIFMNKPYVLYGLHGHPPTDALTAGVARFVCSNAEMVSVRENFYRDALRDIGVTGDHIEAFGDPAYGIDVIRNASVGGEILKDEGIELPDKNVIGVSFRHMYWIWSDDDFKIYSAKMAEFCDRIIERLDARLVVIPNCTYNIDNIREDDRYIAKTFIGQMKNPQCIDLVDREMSLTETLSLYQHIDMIVSNRRHACIFGANYDKPVHALSTGHPWQFKPFIEELGLDGAYASFTEDSLDDLVDGVAQTWKRRDEFSKKIADTMPRLRERSRSQVDHFIEIMS